MSWSESRQARNRKVDVLIDETYQISLNGLKDARKENKQLTKRNLIVRVVIQSEAVVIGYL